MVLSVLVASKVGSMETESVCCNLCGSDTRRVLSDFLMWARLSLVKCRGCGLLYVSPRLTGRSLAVHFNEAYLQPSEVAAWEQSRYPIYRQVLDLIAQHGKKRVFEVGCSHGTFLSMCQASGLEVGGCDISIDACRNASNRTGVEILRGDMLQIHDALEPQECIVSIDTIYYCSDPRRQLTAIHDTLAPGGLLVLRVRNGRYVEWKTRLHLGFPVEHIYFFTPRTLGGLLRQAGFKQWTIVPGACHRLPSLGDVLIRSVSKLLMTTVGENALLTRDFCMVAIKK